MPFRVRLITSLGAPDETRVRDDITGGMATIVYEGGRLLLTQWRTTDVPARIALVPVSGAAEDVTIGDLPALWIEGTARGTFTLIGADGEVHRESFEVGTGVLLWNDGAMTFLLQAPVRKPKRCGSPPRSTGRSHQPASRSSMRSKKVDHPEPARSYSSGDISPRCSNCISVSPSPRSISTTTISS